MKRIIDISNQDGFIFIEDEGHYSDFTIEKTYLFSLSLDLKTNQIEVLHKPYLKAANPFTGKLYISLGSEHIEEGDWTNDYDHYVEHNIIHDDFFGDYVRHDYYGTAIVDMDKQTAKYCDETHHFDFLILDAAQQARYETFNMRSI